MPDIINDPEPNKGPMPSVTIFWDEATHSVMLEFDTRKIKTWDFIIGLCEMTKEFASTQKRAQVMAQMQEQARTQQLVKNIKL